MPRSFVIHTGVRASEREPPLVGTDPTLAMLAYVTNTPRRTSEKQTTKSSNFSPTCLVCYCPMFSSSYSSKRCVEMSPNSCESSVFMRNVQTFKED
ncbi:unnamed protein product [Heterotrigona itama]|uniref:Uncharacterized protein n=1 Tax=Heterotrigona itama TaxID=395501 RepID=A0A6V7HEF8_9HYME|nr:unnamed protein product [Heterotrigona itama]